YRRVRATVHMRLTTVSIIRCSMITSPESGRAHLVAPGATSCSWRKQGIREPAHHELQTQQVSSLAISNHAGAIRELWTQQDRSSAGKAFSFTELKWVLSVS